MNAWRVFNKEWFSNHQALLLWLLNFPLTRRWFRYVLRIRHCDCLPDERISKIAPNHFIVALDGGRFRADFRTHAKFSKRIYYAFKPLWWALHWWDTRFVGRLAPRLAFGFDTLTVYPDPDPEVTSTDGTVGRVTAASGESWATLIAGAGTQGWAYDPTIFALIWAGDTPNWMLLDRAIILFDTGALPDNAIISEGIVSIDGVKSDDFTPPILPDIGLYTSNPASNIDVVPADYSVLGSVEQANLISYADWVNNVYNDFTLNATGRGNISPTGITKFGLRNANYDVAEVAPTWSAATGGYELYAADESGTARDPKLVITYAALTVTTEPATNIGATTATGNGTITDLGDTPVTQHGHVWSLTPTPTTADSRTEKGAGVVGAYTSAISGLAAETLYYVRAYATNSDGTSYGAEVTFTTSAERIVEMARQSVAIPVMGVTDSTTGTTTDSYADALNLDARGLGLKTITLENTHGANSLLYRTRVRAEYTDGGDAERFAEATLAAGDEVIIQLANPYARVIVQVQAAVAGSQATFRTSYIANPVGAGVGL